MTAIETVRFDRFVSALIYEREEETFLRVQWAGERTSIEYGPLPDRETARLIAAGLVADARQTAERIKKEVLEAVQAAFG